MNVCSFPIGLQMRYLSIWLNIRLKTKNELIPLKVEINICVKKEDVSKQRFFTLATKSRKHKDLIFNELLLRAVVALWLKNLLRHPLLTRKYFVLLNLQ